MKNNCFLRKTGLHNNIYADEVKDPTKQPTN